MVERFPRLAPMRARLSQEASEVRNLPAWQEASYSRKCLPWTLELFDRYPELHQLCDIFPMYDPPADDEGKARPAMALGRTRRGVSCDRAHTGGRSLGSLGVTPGRTMDHALRILGVRPGPGSFQAGTGHR